MSQNIGTTIAASLNRGIAGAIEFVPSFISGVVILLLGIILGTIVKRLIIALFDALRIETYLKKYGMPETKREFSWTNILAEISRWFVIILFLIPTADVWRLPQIVTLLNTFILYLPNVFVAAIIGLVGFVVSRLVYDVTLASTREFSSEGATTIASVARWAILIFVLLAVLTQLGVAPDLVKIFFTGVVAMFALAGGIAFGLGGQETAHTLLETLRNSLTNPKHPTKK